MAKAINIFEWNCPTTSAVGQDHITRIVVVKLLLIDNLIAIFDIDKTSWPFLDTSLILQAGKYLDIFACHKHNACLALFAEILKEKPVSWAGKTRAALDNADIYPKTESGHIHTSIGVGGSPQSVVRAARYGFPLMLAVIGGAPDRFIPYVELYKQAAAEFGTSSDEIGIHSPGFIADTDEEAANIAWPAHKTNFDRIGRTRGWPPVTREQFDHEIAHGSLYIGSPETVARKMAKTIQMLGVNRFDLVYGGGPMPASARTHMIELYAKKVIPRVRELLAEPSKKVA